MHMKCYIIDDHVVLSGANLNDQYFTNRQDRYVCIHDRSLANYLEQVIDIIADYSQQLTVDGQFDSNVDVLDARQRTRILNEVGSRLKQLTLDHNRLQSCSTQTNELQENQAQIVPLMQMKCFGVTQDETFTKALLEQLPANSRLRLTSGYFNLTRCYSNLLVEPENNRNRVQIELVAASEETSSFYQAPGLLKHIPSVYTRLIRQFLQQMQAKRLDNIRIRSYFRSKWTYHAKGLWLFEPRRDSLLVTIGSPNFGYRSVHRDLELQCALYTRNRRLRDAFDAEYENIERHTSIVSSVNDLPQVPIWIRLIVPFIKHLF
jgi:CDP-diacylglycerol--glycerol-3-phosphate 3-phosphatidyltransferase